jgi:alkanesulfonate monooxygenase SsuD/methylene tetrahydromethanopterin reductase-like flavin-dependent oxidoreductase (luciferase family)
VTFAGDFYQVQSTKLVPKGPREHGPPLLIGLLARKPRMQRLIVQYADIWNAWLAFRNSAPAVYRDYVPVMEAACERHGRDPQTLGRHVAVGITMPGAAGGVPGAAPLTGSPAAVAEQLNAFVELGAEHITVYLTPTTPQGIEWLGRVLDALPNRRAQQHSPVLD